MVKLHNVGKKENQKRIKRTSTTEILL